MLSSLDRQMVAYRGRPVFFDSLSGNNGDRLISAGSEAALRAWQVRRTFMPDDAEVIIINGGGGMLDPYTGPVTALKHYLVEFPHIPLIVLPQSYDFKVI